MWFGFVFESGFFPRHVMLRENEDEGMRGPNVFCGGSSCWHMFAPSVRGKKPSSRVKQLRWLHIQLLVVLLAGQASCDEPLAFPDSLSLATTKALPSEVYYHILVTVDVTEEPKNQTQIKEWLTNVFQNDLVNCEETTTTSTSPQTTYGTTPQVTSTTSKSDSATTAATSTTSKSKSTTTAATSAMTGSDSITTTETLTTSKSDSTITAATSATSKSDSITTAKTSTTTKSDSITTAKTSTTTKSDSITTTETLTTSKSKSTTTVRTNPFTTTSVDDGKIKPSKNPNSGQSNNKQRIAREISGKQTSVINNGETTSLFQGIEVLCTMKTAVTQNNCSVTLNLRQSVPPCCILRTLCAASKADIRVVGKSAAKANPLQNECSSNPQEEISCIYTGQTGALCEESGTSYKVIQSNTSHCAADKQNNTCNCSAYCSGKDAYYSLDMSIQDPKLNASSLTSLAMNLKESLNCSPDSGVSCPPADVVSALRDLVVTCESTATRCTGILAFTQEVPTCDVLDIVRNVFQAVKQINYTVTQAAYCGHSDNPLTPPFTWIKRKIKPADFCEKMESNMLSCQNGKIIFVELDDQCVHGPAITLGPNVTTAQPNTTLSVNVTASPLNTTAEATTADVTLSATTTTESADSQANALLELTRDVSKLNSSQVDQLVSQLESLLSGPTVSLALGNISVNIVSNLLDASPETLSDSSDRIIGIVDTVAFKLVLNGKAETLLSPSVALSVKPADGSNFQETFFSISDPNNVEVGGDTRSSRSVRKDSSIPQGSIKLPPSLTDNLSSEEQQLASRVQFNFYQKSTVFQDSSMGVRRLNSGILGASVANLSISELQEDVVIHLRHTEPIPANFVATCVFWDFTKNDGSGGWNPRGCDVQNSTDNETICGCNHLTSFAILLDLSREPLTSRVQATILTFITYIGCGISAIFLSVTLLTYLAFGKLRKDIPSKILIQLCLSLLLLNLVFLVDAWLALYPDAVGLCISTAWFLHYFLLVAFTWMGLEAVHMYLALVKVFNSYISRYMLKFSLVGWGIPMIVVIIVIAIDKDNYGLVSYGRFSDGTTDEFCWLKNDIAFYVAVVAYFCVIFLFNFIMFIVVLVQLCRIKRQNPHSVLHRTTLQDARSVAGITILLGLTWGFAFFAWGPVNLPFMYLFAIFNSLQGFFIFVFHCAVKENVRRQWRTYLCCGKMRLAENSEWSRTATQKTAKKSSVTRLTSSKSNNSTSSSTFLVSDSSEQINGIGSPFEDRTITADEEPSRDVILNEINSQYRHQHAS